MLKSDPNAPQYEDNGTSAIVTRRWPACLAPHRISDFGLPLPIVHIGTTEAGIEARQKISDIPRGAYIEMEMRWLEEDEIETLYDFILGRPEYRERTEPDPEAIYGGWRSFLLSEGIKRLVPGWDSYAPYLPTQLWRLDLGDNPLEGIPVSPSGCCALDLNLRLVNLVSPRLPQSRARAKTRGS